MNERRTIDPTLAPTSAPQRARRATWIAAATAGLLIVTPALAHGGAWGGAADRDRGGPGAAAPRVEDGMRPGAGARRSRGAGTPAALMPGMLQRLPLGTEVTVALYDGDPAEGSEPRERLTALVGETSEVAFAEDVASAAQDAAFLVVEIGPRVQRVDLSELGDRGPRAPLARLTGRLDVGDTVEVAFYAEDGDASPAATLSFTYGEDSEAAFRADLTEAAADAAVAEISLPAEARTIDLSAGPFAAAPGGARPGARMPGRAR